MEFENLFDKKVNRIFFGTLTVFIMGLIAKPLVLIDVNQWNQPIYVKKIKKLYGKIY